MRKLLRGALCLALAMLGIPATALGADQSVTGVATNTLAISGGTPAAFGTSFTPGASPTATGTLIVTTTSPTWTLAVKDSGSTPGRMDAAGVGCTGSASSLASAVQVAVTGGGTSAGTVSISGSDQTVASAGGGNPGALLAAAVLTTTFTQPIGAGETLLAGCAYSLTATYTLS